jgi:Tol biopolymer transport system component
MSPGYLRKTLFEKATTQQSVLKWILVFIFFNVILVPNAFAQSHTKDSIIDLGNNGDQMFPAWQPQGRYLAYQSNQNGNWDIFLYDLKSNKISQVTFSEEDDEHPVWVPGKNALVYDSKRDGKWHIYYIDLDTGKEKLLFNQEVEAREASFTPSRHLVAFSGFDPSSNHWQIFTYDLVFNNLNLLTMLQGDAHFPVFNHDGKEIAYNVRDFTGNHYIQLTNWFGDFFKFLTKGRGKVSWSPDSWHLVFILKVGGSESIIRLGQDDSDFEKLYTSKTALSGPVLSPDGKEIAFSQQTASGWKIMVKKLSI